MSGKIKGMVMGIITIIVSVVLFPIILTGTAAALATANLNTFTALNTILTLVPLLALVGMVAAGGWMTITAAKGGTSDIMRVVWGEIVIFLFITLYPIIIPVFVGLIAADNNTYTGFTPVAKIVPLLILIGGLFGGGMLMFQGAKGKGGGGKRHRRWFRRR